MMLSTTATATATTWPTAPEDAPGGELARLVRMRDAQRPLLGAAAIEVRDLARQHDDLRRIVSAATPASDFAALAAAQAGLPVVEAELGRARQREGQRDGNLREAQRKIDVVWADLLALRRQLAGGVPYEQRRPRDVIESSIRALLGCLPSEPA